MHWIVSVDRLDALSDAYIDALDALDALDA